MQSMRPGGRDRIDKSRLLCYVKRSFCALCAEMTFLTAALRPFPEAVMKTLGLFLIATMLAGCATTTNASFTGNIGTARQQPVDEPLPAMEPWSAEDENAALRKMLLKLQLE